MDREQHLAQGFSSMAKRSRRYLLGVALRLTRGAMGDAEDLVQDAMVRAFRRFPQGRLDSERAWLKKIIVRLHLDSLRRVATRAAVFREYFRGIDASLQTSEAPAWIELTNDNVRTALAQLEDRYRVPFELVEIEGLNYDLAAIRLGLNRNTLASRIRRARRALRK